MITEEVSMQQIGNVIYQERKIINEISSLFNHLKKADSEQEKKMIFTQIESLKNSLKKTSQQIIDSTERIFLFKQLTPETNPMNAPPAQPIQKIPTQPLSNYQQIPVQKVPAKKSERKIKAEALEKLTIKRITGKGKKKKSKKKEKKASKFTKVSSSIFYNFSMTQLNKGKFRKLRRDLVKAHMGFVPANYISVIFLSTIISIFVAILVTIFFLFFNFVASPPFFVMAEDAFGIRILKVFWILFLIPGATFLFAYFYPNMEKKTLETKLDRELPFAAIHMSSISGSLIEPSKIFEIISSTKEYPNLEKEFIKLQNEINIYGYDLVTALRNRAHNSPSVKLAELFNGLATTITSGGKLPEFFEKRAETLLFEHRLNMEKESKASETFMDIYISVVIAAPMILMLLLMMMRISGLGFSLSTNMITLVMILGVSLINVLFLGFLHLKKPTG